MKKYFSRGVMQKIYYVTYFGKLKTVTHVFKSYFLQRTSQSLVLQNKIQIR